MVVYLRGLMHEYGVWRYTVTCMVLARWLRRRVSQWPQAVSLLDCDMIATAVV